MLGAPPDCPPPAGDPLDEGRLPAEGLPVDGGVGQPSGCGGGGGPDPPGLEPLPDGEPPLEPGLPWAGDCDPGCAPPPDDVDWEGDDDGEPELPDGDCCPELPPELGLDGDELPGEEGDDEGIELGMPLGIELELVVRQPLVASAAVATASAVVSPEMRCMPV